MMAVFFVTACKMSAPYGNEASDEGTYQSRLTSMMGIDNIEYAPLEAIPGAPKPKHFNLSRDLAIKPTELAAAREYAETNHSTAFLVWRAGVFEQAAYFGGTDADTPLVSKSLAKPLTAIVIGRAIELGYVKSLDQPVSDFITEWRRTPKQSIKIRHLLDMRSGFLGQHYTQDNTPILNRAYLDTRHDRILINDYPLTNEPGMQFDYSNAVADMVAIVIERATRMRYSRFVSREILRPLGAAGGSVWIDHPGGLAHSACCTLFPAETWLRFALLLMDDGAWDGKRILPKGYVAEMCRGTLQNPWYGLGVYVAAPYVERRAFVKAGTSGALVFQSKPFLADDIFMFDGNANQVTYMIPSERLIILRMGGPPLQKPEWDNAVLPNLILRGLYQRAPNAVPQSSSHP